MSLYLFEVNSAENLPEGLALLLGEGAFKGGG